MNNRHRPVAGILFCIGSLLLFAIQDALIKHLSQRYPVLEVLTLRSLIVLLLLFVDLPGPSTVFGAALALLSGLYILYREQRQPPDRRQSKSATGSYLVHASIK